MLGEVDTARFILLVRHYHPRQRQTRREAGTQSYGLLTVLRGGQFKAARLPKGWTGPVSMLGGPGFRKEARIFLCAELWDRFSTWPEQTGQVENLSHSSQVTPN